MIKGNKLHMRYKLCPDRDVRFLWHLGKGHNDVRMLFLCIILRNINIIIKQGQSHLMTI
jgi:hypothetical protein